MYLQMSVLNRKFLYIFLFSRNVSAKSDGVVEKNRSSSAVNLSSSSLTVLVRVIPGIPGLSNLEEVGS